MVLREGGGGERRGEDAVRGTVARGEDKRGGRKGGRGYFDTVIQKGVRAAKSEVFFPS